MVRKNGDISPSGIKADIIEFILGKNGSAEESQIRKQLNKDQGNVNRHLHELEERGCIELTQTIKKGRRTYNIWDITKLGNLRNIQTYFKDIKLNNYEKSLMIILNETGHAITSLNGLQFYIRLLLSASFFDTCIKTNIETLFSRAWNIYLYDKGSEDDQRIKELLNEFYSLYIKDNSNFEMSIEIFQKTIEELAQKKAEISDDAFSNIWEENFYGLYKETSRDMFLKTKEELTQRVARLAERVPAAELFYKTFEEKYPGLSREAVKEILIDRVYHEILDEESRRSKVHENSIDNLWKTQVEDREMHTKMERILELIGFQQSDFKLSRFNLLLEHFLKHDILTGGDFQKELEFAKKIKENEATRDALFIESKVQRDREEVIIKWFLGDLEQSSKIIFNYKQPSIFCKNFSTSDEVYQGLIDYFGFRSVLE